MATCWAEHPHHHAAASRGRAASRTGRPCGRCHPAFAGRMSFVYIHVVWFGTWIAVNTGRFGIHPFDPFPYGLLTLIVSLEAIFLATSC